MIGRAITYTAGRDFSGATNTMIAAADADHIGEVQAWNVDTDKRVWSHPLLRFDELGADTRHRWGLVFNGGTSDRKFRALMPRTARCCGNLWPIQE